MYFINIISLFIRLCKLSYAHISDLQMVLGSLYNTLVVEMLCSLQNSQLQQATVYPGVDIRWTS